MSRVELIESKSKSDHIPIMVTLEATPHKKIKLEKRHVIRKDISQDEILKELLYNSDWPRIPFNMCWSIKKFLFIPKDAK